MKKASLIQIAVAAALIGTAGAVSAAPTTFSVTAQVNATCIIDSASAMSFSSYTPGGGDQLATSSVSVRCTNGTPFDIGLDAGATSGGTVTNRMMASGTNRLNYALYQDANRTVNWGNTQHTDTWSSTGAGMAATSAISKTVYGKIPDQPNAVPGSYSDTVTVSVYF